MSESGSKIKLKFRRTTANYTIDSCYIQEKGASAPDFSSSPVQITFDSGNSGTTITADGTWSDEIDFSLDETKDYVISMFISTGIAVPYAFETGTVIDYYRKLTTDESNVVDVSGYTEFLNYAIAISEIQVYG